MRIVSSVQEMQRQSREFRPRSKKIAVVPTMGSLHEGHLSLIRLARENAEIVVTTVFVNPTQFAEGEDFTKYPRDIERDSLAAESEGTDILFVPDVEEMYPKGFRTFVEVPGLSGLLEGKSRPGHFRGVCTIVAKLFNCIMPDVAVFGQKDAQQVLVVSKMARDLDFPVRIIVAPTLREGDGLAMSSRNVYLSPVERAEAVVLYHSLQLSERLIGNGERNCRLIISEMEKLIMTKPSARIDYVSIADASTLMELESLQRGDVPLLSLAVKIGGTRLIDNLTIKVP